VSQQNIVEAKRFWPVLILAQVSSIYMTSER